MIKKLFSKASFLYSFSSVLKSGVQMIVGVAVARFINPEDFGLWSSLNLILTYALIIQFGLINGVNLELPIAIGRKNSDLALKIISTAQYYILLCILFIIIIGFTIIIFFHSDISHKMIWGLVAVIIMITLSFYQDLLIATFRTPQSFIKLSKINIIHAIVNFVTIVMILYFSYYGLIFKSLITLIIYVVFLHLNRPLKSNVKFSKDTFLKLINVGFPIFLLAYIQASAMSFDRLLLLKFSNLADVGIYSFAYLSFTAITLLSTSIASYIYPTMTHMYAENNSPLQLWTYLKRNILKVIIGLGVLGAVGILIIPIIIFEFFPKYIHSILPMQILLGAGIFNGGVIGVNVLLSMKKWKLITIYHLMFSFLLVLFPFLGFFLFKNQIVALSAGVLVANVLNFFIAYSLVYFAFFKSK